MRRILFIEKTFKLPQRFKATVITKDVLLPKLAKIMMSTPAMTSLDLISGKFMMSLHTAYLVASPMNAK